MMELESALFVLPPHHTHVRGPRQKFLTSTIFKHVRKARDKGDSVLPLVSVIRLRRLVMELEKLLMAFH